MPCWAAHTKARLGEWLRDGMRLFGTALDERAKAGSLGSRRPAVRYGLWYLPLLLVFRHDYVLLSARCRGQGTDGRTRLANGRAVLAGQHIVGELSESRAAQVRTVPRSRPNRERSMGNGVPHFVRQRRGYGFVRRSRSTL